MPNFIDLTGKKFGRLEVISRNPKNATDKSPQWNCRCDYGNETVVQGRHLRSGHTKSCGCMQKEIAGQINFKNIIGQRFGKLTVVKHIGSNNKGNAIWECKCDCGNIIQAQGIYLRNSHVQSCGCISSLGESKIQNLLENNKINFSKQKTFETCRFSDSNQMAKFDFYINDYYLIEYDGIQHFQETCGNWEPLVDIQNRDKQKNNWCKDNNIPLIRIPYTRFNNLTIDDLLLETTKYRVV